MKTNRRITGKKGGFPAEKGQATYPSRTDNRRFTKPIPSSVEGVEPADLADDRIPPERKNRSTLSHAIRLEDFRRTVAGAIEKMERKAPHSPIRNLAGKGVPA